MDRDVKLIQCEILYGSHKRVDEYEFHHSVDELKERKILKIGTNNP